MKKILTLVLSFILPGIGQIAIGRIAVGIAFFLGEVTLFNSFVCLQYNTSAPPAPWQSGLIVGCFVFLWLGCQAHLAYWLFLRDPSRYNTEKELAFREGLRYYLLDEFSEAMRQFQRVLRFDPCDCDACFHLAVCCSRCGMYRRAKRLFRKCADLDDARKWAEETQDELLLVQEARKQRRLKAKPKPADV